MADLDVLERRVIAVLLDYVGQVPDAVDAAAVARRVALEHPRRRGPIVGGLWTTVPRIAWVLLLVTLFAAVVGGMLLVGSKPEPKLAAVLPPVGQVFTCPPGSTPDKPGPVDQARPDMGAAVAFDRRAGRLVVVTNAGSSVETWTFDVCTNTWTRMHPNLEPPSFEYAAQLVYDVDSDMTIGISYDIEWTTPGRVWAYDLQANTWTEKGVAPTDARPWAYDPVSGLVVAATCCGSTELWNYDVETNTWSPIHQANSPAEEPGAFAYDASVDRIVAYLAFGSGTWLFDIRTGTWSRSGAETPGVIDIAMQSLPAIAYDEAAKRTVVIGDVRLAAYDATADRWEILAEADPDRSEGFPLPAVYDPVNGRLVGWRRFATVDQGELFAFDLATREWIVLLEPSERQAAP